MFAIDTNDAIGLARQVCADNDYDDQIRFFHARSQDVVLPAQADVLIADLRGALPLHSGSVAALIDARDRLLTPSGTLLPCTDTLHAAVVSAQKQYDAMTSPWDIAPAELAMGTIRTSVLNTLRRFDATEARYLSEPEGLGMIDYRVVSDPNWQGEATFTIREPGRAHGVVAWFESEFDSTHRLSSAPTVFGGDATIYGQGFFPWLDALQLEVDDRIQFRCRAAWVGLRYHWRWTTQVHRAGKTLPKAQFDQSTFWGDPISADAIDLTDPTSAPNSAQCGDVVRFVLDRCNGQRPLREIAQQTAEAFPSVYPSIDDAQRTVSDLVRCFHHMPKRSPLIG